MAMGCHGNEKDMGLAHGGTLLHSFSDVHLYTHEMQGGARIYIYIKHTNNQLEIV